MRKSMFSNPGPTNEFRASPGNREAERAVPELFTTPPVNPPAGPPDGNPLIVPVTGCPDVKIAMVEKWNPSKTFRATGFEIRFVKVGIQMKFPVNRCVWFKSEVPYSSLRL